MVEGGKRLADQMVLTQCGRSSGYRRFLDSHKHGSGGATNYYTGQNVTKRKGKKCKGLEHGGREEVGREAGRGRSSGCGCMQAEVGSGFIPRHTVRLELRGDGFQGMGSYDSLR
ncbi:unnamed protein product [Sphagnum jensenii]|uniref:Uncharacterized protein n=1 Tax=Sphagnum jensenii TaxID=128206 RepID=A0ABP1A8D6_9BRYO